jgi:hypothetical protein
MSEIKIFFLVIVLYLIIPIFIYKNLFNNFEKNKSFVYKVIFISDYFGIILFISAFKVVSFENGLNFYDFINVYSRNIIVFYIILIMLILNVLAPTLGMKYAIKKRISEKVDINVYNKNKDYYREIIEKYSPGEINYIYNFSLSNNTIVGILLDLELKKKIIINNYNIEILNNDNNNLNYSEQYIFKLLSENKLKYINYMELEDYVIKDCINDKLLINNNKYIKLKNTKKVYNLLKYILLILLIVIVLSKKSLLLICLITFLLLFIMTYYFTYANSLLNNEYICSDMANELNYKLNGLKNFLNDFGNIKNKTNKELILWDEYLIYSVIFEININLINKMSKKFKIN